MFKDDSRKFFLYALGSGVLIILIFCIMQVVLLKQDIPFIGSKKELGPYEYESYPAMGLKDEIDYNATIMTNMGDFKIELFEKNTPMTVNNFIFLSKKDYYNGVKIHRILKDFLFQTGDRNTLGTNTSEYGFGGPGYVFSDEINWDSLSLNSTQTLALSQSEYLSNSSLISKRMEKYSVAMANDGPDTNGSQFFIVTAENSDPKLDDLQGRHTVFGKVTDGFEVINKINEELVDVTDKNTSIPLRDVIINRIIIREIELDK